MENLNTQIFDLLTLRSLTLERVKNGVANDVMSVYKSIFDDLIDRVKQEDSINANNVNAIIKELKNIIDPELTLMTDMHDLAIAEASFLTTSINAVAGVELFKKIPKDSTLIRIANTSLFEGATILKTFDAFSSAQKSIVEKQIKQAVFQGESVQDIKDRLVKRSGIAQKQSETLARTFTANIVNQVRDEVYSENEDVLKGYQYRATLDSRTRKEHAIKDGLIYDVDKKPIKHDFKYVNLPDGYNCRCIYLPITKSYKELELNIDEIPLSTRASMDGEVAEDISFTEWFKSKHKAFQEKYLGKGRFELYEQGKITFSDLVNQRGEVLTIEELKKLSS